MTKNKSEEAENPTAQVTAVINAMPVGSVISYVGNANSFPPGWMICNGANFNQAQYPELYAALGNSNTLPNLSGYFLRGLDPSGNVDPDGKSRTVRSLQGDTFGAHSHDTAHPPWKYNQTDNGNQYYVGGPTTSNNLFTQTSTTVGGAETRPKNAAVLYLIFAGLPQQ